VRVRAILAGAVCALLTYPLIAVGADLAHREVVLNGANEVPPVVTAGSGTGWVTITADNATITYHVQYSGLSGPATAAHIHTGAAGVAGGVILPLAVGPSPMDGTLTAANFSASGAITTYAEAVAAIKAGNTYINVHTAANPGGEIRGQILPLAPSTSTEPSGSGAGIGQLALVLGVSLLVVMALMARRTPRRVR
jgi:hypothetical protein